MNKLIVSVIIGKQNIFRHKHVYVHVWVCVVMIAPGKIVFMEAIYWSWQPTKLSLKTKESSFDVSINKNPVLNGNTKLVNDDSSQIWTIVDSTILLNVEGTKQDMIKEIELNKSVVFGIGKDYGIQIRI